MNSCQACGGDGIQKPEARLKSGAVRRCISCRGRGMTGEIKRKPGQWWSVKFKTKDGDVIRVTTKGTTENEARLNARRLLDPALHCEML
jgi:hypothetical protein